MKQIETDRPIGGAYGIVMLLVLPDGKRITGRSLKALVQGGVPVKSAVAYRQIYKQTTSALTKRVQQERN